MLRLRISLSSILAACAAFPAAAADIDSLKGQFTFDWHSDPSSAVCATIDDKLLATLKSDLFECNLEPVTNTASGETARVCSKKGGEGEYLIFATQKSCELERETQASNAE